MLISTPTLVSMKEYCPSVRADWTIQDDIKRRVALEDERNHADTPSYMPPVVKPLPRPKKRPTAVAIKAFAKSLLP